MSQVRILVVDDDPVIRHLLKKVLEKKYVIETASNGVEAWELILELQGNFDLVLTDIHMPRLDGISLLNRIQSEHFDIGVILISGSTDLSNAIQALRKGAYDYISKPFHDITELELIVERWLYKQSLEAKLSQYAKLHRQMTKNLKIRSFVSIDVAGSKELKRDEDPFLVQYSFQQYHNYVKGIVLNNNGTIHATSGDGIMCCFENAQSAAKSAISVLTDLEQFNDKSSRLNSNFKLRIGIHTGPVIANKDGLISETYSEALDIAGHIQKSAHRNQLAISKVTMDILNRDDFKMTEQVIDGYSVYTFDDPAIKV